MNELEMRTRAARKIATIRLQIDGVDNRLAQSNWRGIDAFLSALIARARDVQDLVNAHRDAIGDLPPRPVITGKTVHTDRPFREFVGGPMCVTDEQGLETDEEAATHQGLGHEVVWQCFRCRRFAIADPNAPACTHCEFQVKPLVRG